MRADATRDIAFFPGSYARIAWRCDYSCISLPRIYEHTLAKVGAWPYYPTTGACADLGGFWNAISEEKNFVLLWGLAVNN